jgi:hypothetical protein
MQYFKQSFLIGVGHFSWGDKQTIKEGIQSGNAQPSHIKRDFDELSTRLFFTIGKTVQKNAG